MLVAIIIIWGKNVEFGTNLDVDSEFLRSGTGYRQSENDVANHRHLAKFQFSIVSTDEKVIDYFFSYYFSYVTHYHFETEPICGWAN